MRRSFTVQHQPIITICILVAAFCMERMAISTSRPEKGLILKPDHWPRILAQAWEKSSGSQQMANLPRETLLSKMQMQVQEYILTGTGMYKALHSIPRQEISGKVKWVHAEV